MHSLPVTSPPLDGSDYPFFSKAFSMITDQFMAFCMAVENYQFRELRRLSFADENLINQTDSNGRSPLMFAVTPDEYGDPDSPAAVLKMVEFLLGLGADKLMISSTGQTAFDLACQWTDPEWKDNYGRNYAKRWQPSQLNELKAIRDLLNPRDESMDKHGEGNK